MRKRIGVLSTAGLLVATGVVPPALAQEAREVIVAPTQASSTRKGYFFVRTSPGRRVTQGLAVSNTGSEPVQMKLFAVDAVTGPYGGASFGLPEEPVRFTGKWIKLARTVVRVPGRSTVRIPFSIEVPPEARSGTHLAGIAIYKVLRKRTGSKASKGSSVAITTRRVIAVQVVLPGPSAPRIAISGIRPAARPDGLYLEILMTNRGHGLAKGRGAITLAATGFQEEWPLDTFVPRTSIGYPIKWTARPRQGSYDACVDLRYTGSRRAHWCGSFAVDAQIARELEARGVPVGAPLDVNARPLLIVIAAILNLLVAAALWILIGKRRRSEPAEALEVSP